MKIKKPVKSYKAGKNKNSKIVKPHAISKIISKDKVFVIAEIGKNFIQTQESQPLKVYIKNAKKLIDEAVKAGAHAVKFQTHEVEDEQANINVVSPHFKGSDRYSWVKRNTEEAPIEFFKEIKRYSEKKGIIFFSTPMSRMAAVKLENLDVPFWKVGSGDVQDHVLLDFLTKTQKPIIISTGMVSHKELDDVVNYITKRGSPIIILYCVSEYPCPPEAFNLSTIEYFKEKYPHAIIGFSDHSVGDNTIPLAAVKMGAQVIEKHFSLDRGLWGSDHKASVTPEEMKQLVSGIKKNEYKKIDTNIFYGQKEKELEGAQNKFRPYFNKTLVASRDIKAGTIITSDMVYAMRPRLHLNGIFSNFFHDILDKKIIKDIKKFEPLTEEHVDREYRTPNVLGVITARGGSKGIPGKNIKKLGNKPLIAYTIDAAKKSKLINHLIVSTDDKEIADVCKKYGADVPFMRPKELAQDGTPHLPVMQHAIDFYEKKNNITIDYVVILQPTSPFRTIDDIDGTIQKLIDTKADSAVSIVEVPSNVNPIKIKKLEGDFISAYSVPEVEGTRRQDLPVAYKRSAAIYSMRRDLIMKENKLYGDKDAGYIVPKDRSVDIDYPLDWIIAEYMLKELKKKGFKF